MSKDRHVVQCNLVETTKVAPAGARAYVVWPNFGGGHDRVMVLLRSHGGRWVRKWEDARRLTRFRVVTLPVQHPLYSVDLFEPLAERAESDVAAMNRATCSAA